MTTFLKQSTTATLRVGPAVDATNGVTPETTLDLSTADQAELLKASGATVDISGATFAAITGVAGWYDLSLTTAHTDTVGMLTVVVQDESLCLPIFARAMVLPANVFDSLMGSDFLQVDVAQWLGTNAATPSVAGVPEVDVTHFGGAAGTFASGIPDTNAAQISGDATAAANLEQALDDTAGTVPWVGIIDQGTAQSATSTTVVLRAAAAFADDTLIGATIAVFGSTQGYWQVRQITDYVGATDTATVDAWTVTPSGTITYKVFATPPSSTVNPATVDVVRWNGAAVAATSVAGVPEVDLTHVAGSLVSTTTAQLGVNTVQAGGTAWGSGAITPGSIATAAITAAKFGTGAIDAAAIADSAIDAGAIATGALTSTKFAAGAIDAAALATAAITAAKFGAGALDAAALAADAVTEIQSGLATSAALSTVDANVDTLLESQEVYKKNVAAANFLFPMELTDGTPGTGLTVSGSIIKDAGASNALTNAIAEVSNGWYRVSLTQAEMNADEIGLFFTAATAKQLNIKIKTQA